MQTADDNQLRVLIPLLCDTIRLGHSRKFERSTEDMETFAFQAFAEVAANARANLRQIVSVTAETVKQVLGYESGVRFLVEQLEAEPERFFYRNDRIWNQHHGSLAEWRARSQNLDPGIEERLLAIVVAELRSDLTLRKAQSVQIYSNRYSWFWSEKRAAFAAVAEEVLTEQAGTGEGLTYLALYFADGLEMPERGIQILSDALREDLLNETQISTLVRLLQNNKRWAESIPILKLLITDSPRTLDYRVRLLNAYYHAAQVDPVHFESLTELLAETQTYFKQQSLWEEAIVASLASTALDCELLEEAVELYREAVLLHQQATSYLGKDDSQLSGYYMQMATAYEQLDETRLAVDAATSAIVSWGNSSSNREAAIESLIQVLTRAEDRDAYAQFLDQEAERTAQDRPIVRKALGQAYKWHDELDKATRQLELAVNLEPNDLDTHQLLIEIYQAKEDTAAETRQWFELVQVERRDAVAYERLAELLTDPVEKERAFTSIVEMKPSDAEAHTMLANIRQGQDRWENAASHWKRVAQLRSFDPAGLLGLLTVQIELKAWSEAELTLKQLGADPLVRRIRSCPHRCFEKATGEGPAERRRSTKDRC